MQWTKISEIHLLKGSIRLVFLVRWNREFDQFSFLSYNTNEEFPNFANFDLLSIGRVSRKKLRNNVLGHERAFSNVPGGRAPATRIFAFRGERVFPTFFFSSIPARSVCRSSALIASKNVGRARVPLPRIPSSPFRNVPMIFRPPNSHLSLTGHATNKISSASPWPPAWNCWYRKYTLFSLLFSPPSLQEHRMRQDGGDRTFQLNGVIYSGTKMPPCVSMYSPWPCMKFPSFVGPCVKCFVDSRTTWSRDDGDGGSKRSIDRANNYRKWFFDETLRDGGCDFDPWLTS